MTKLLVGLSANAAGAHTQELLDGFREAQDWTGIACDHIWAEDGRDPTVARDAAHTLVAAGVPLVIGHLSAAASLSAARIYAQSDTALVAPATSHPDLNPGNWEGIVRVCGTDAETAQIMLSAAPRRCSSVIICQDQIFGRSLAACLQRAMLNRGEPPVELWVYTERDALPRLPPEVAHVFVTGIHEYCADVVRSLRRLRPGIDITCGDDCLTSNFLHLAGDAAEGLRIICPVVPGAGDFSQGYKPAAAIGTAIALQALAERPDARGAALGRLMRDRSWPTPYGNFSFDELGDVAGLKTETFRVAKGNFQAVAVPRTANPEQLGRGGQMPACGSTSAVRA